MIDGEVRSQPDGSFLVPSGPGRADFALMTRDLLGRQYPGVSPADLPERGGAGLVLVVNDLAAARQTAGAAAVSIGAAVVVPPAAGNGVLLAFVSR